MVACRHAGAFRASAAYDLQTSSCRLSYVPPTVLVPTRPPVTLLLASSSHWSSRLLYNRIYLANICSSLLGLCPCNSPLLYWRGGQWNDQPVAYCPARPPVLIHFPTTHVLPHTPIRTFVFHLHFHPTSPLHSLIPHVWLVQWNSLPKCLYFHRFSPYPNSLDDIPLFPSPLSTPWHLPPSSPHFQILRHVLFTNSPHSLLTPPPFRRRLLRIVLRFLGDCPRAGLFAATTLSRFWNSVATNAWLGVALAVTCAFYAVFASPSQINWADSEVEAVSRFTNVSPLLRMRSHCLRVYLALDFSQNSISHEILN